MSVAANVGIGLTLFLIFAGIGYIAWRGIKFSERFALLMFSAKRAQQLRAGSQARGSSGASSRVASAQLAIPLKAPIFPHRSSLPSVDRPIRQIHSSPTPAPHKDTVRASATQYFRPPVRDIIIRSSTAVEAD
ncbi:hypothetical protein F5B20DRAFT_586518 [Whalleya microplaca]|nr:hypothetical protein F5B20DRAFT_586518 [Whalleya microplaca]